MNLSILSINPILLTSSSTAIYGRPSSERTRAPRPAGARSLARLANCNLATGGQVAYLFFARVDGQIETALLQG